jgi:hypothetical protein
MSTYLSRVHVEVIQGIIVVLCVLNAWVAITYCVQDGKSAGGKASIVHRSERQDTVQYRVRGSGGDEEIEQVWEGGWIVHVRVNEVRELTTLLYCTAVCCAVLCF